MQSGWFTHSFVLLLMFSGCRTSQTVEATEPLPSRHLYQVVEWSDEPDAPDWLQAYRVEMDAVRNRTVAHATTDLEGGGPESPLWNLMSDLFRFRTTLIAETFIHVALLDPDRFQVDLEQGRITGADLYHFYPEPDPVTVLGMTREQMDELAHQIARAGPVPMSGLRMVISGDRARNVVLDYADLTQNGLYHVAVPSHLLYSGLYPVLEEAVTSNHFEVRVRDLISAHMRTYGSVEGYRDLRLRVLPAPDCEDGQEALASRCL